MSRSGVVCRLVCAAGRGGEDGPCGEPVVSAAPRPAAPLPSLVSDPLAPTSPRRPHPPAPSPRILCSGNLRPFCRRVRVVWLSCVRQGEALPHVSAHHAFIHGTGGLGVREALWAGAAT